MDNTVLSLKTRDVRPFEQTIDINPKFYRIQRVTATTSFNRASFRTEPPAPNMLLYAYAPIKWTFGVERRDDLGGPAVLFPVANRDVIYQKPYSMTNCMKNITMSINGYGFNYPDIGIWGKYIHQVFSNRQHMRKKFSVCGGPFPTYQGAYDEQFTSGGEVDREDEGIKQATNLAFNHYADSIGVTGLFEVNCLEPLMVGLFNPYEEKHTLPKWCWYKQTSWMIPHVKRFQLDIEFSDLAQNSFVYAYAFKTAITDEIVLQSTPDIQNLRGELILTWISPDAGYVVPKQVSLNSWNLRHFEFQLNNNNDLVNDENITFDTGILQLQQVPTSILIFATSVREDHNCFALAQDTDGNGANQTTHFEDGSMELNLSIEDITITIEVNSKVIDIRFSQQELYKITEQNCNTMPYMFSSYVGGFQQYATTPGNMFLYLRPQDLNISTSTGKLVTNFTFQIDGRLRVRQGFSFDNNTFLGAGDRDADQIYNLHVVTFFNNYSVSLEEDGRVSANYVVHAI